MPAVIYANNSLAPYQVQLPNGTVVGAQTTVTLQAITGAARPALAAHGG